MALTLALALIGSVSTAYGKDVRGCTVSTDSATVYAYDGPRLALDEVSRAVRAVPHAADARAPYGLELLLVRAGTTLDTCGLRKGDIVTGVSAGDASYELDTMAAMMAAYDAIAGEQTIDTLTVRIVREGAPLALTIRGLRPKG